MGDEEQEPLPSSERGPRPRVSLLGAILLVVAAAIILWLAVDLLLLLFVGVLLAIFLRTLAWWFCSYTRLPVGWSLLVVILLLVGATVLAGFLFAPRLAEQVEELSETLPEALNQLEDRLREYPIGRWLAEEAPEKAREAEGMVDRATDWAAAFLRAIIGVVIVLFVGIYLAARPEGYIRGVLRLVAVRRRERVGEVIFAAGWVLRWWLFGQLLGMVLVGVLTGVGLALIGIPLSLAFGVLAGLLEFVPNIGPPLAILPAVLLGLAESAEKALYVLILYAVIQTVEANIVTPLIHARVIHLHPVLTISAQLFLAWTVGFLGVLVAVPLVAVARVAIQMLYVQDVLGDKTLRVDGIEEARQDLAESDLLSTV